MTTPPVLVLTAILLTGACGGNPPTPATAPPAPPRASPVSETAAQAAPPQAASSPAPSTEAPYDDPIEAEHGAVITLTPTLERNTAASAFPKRTVGDRECWQGTALAGEARKDFDTLIGKCGAPTGLREYARPVIGKLHHEHDKRDTYKIKLRGGMCYRYFAVADGTVKDLDILVTKPNGALIADDKTSHPVAIIEFDKSWCMDDDAEYDFHVEVDGVGAGHYMFGVWVKPKGI